MPAGGVFAGGPVVAGVAPAGAGEVAVLGAGCVAEDCSGVLVAGGAGVAAEVSAPFDGGGVAFVVGSD